jgi:DNA transformation protein
MKTDIAVQPARLEDIPNIGKKIAGNLRQLGYEEPSQLREQDPYAMYDRLCALTGSRHDPCLLDTFIAAVRFMDGGPAVPWWAFTAERKREMEARKTIA